MWLDQLNLKDDKMTCSEVVTMVPSCTCYLLLVLCVWYTHTTPVQHVVMSVFHASPSQNFLLFQVKHPTYRTNDTFVSLIPLSPTTAALPRSWTHANTTTMSFVHVFHHPKIALWSPAVWKDVDSLRATVQSLCICGGARPIVPPDQPRQFKPLVPLVCTLWFVYFGFSLPLHSWWAVMTWPWHGWPWIGRNTYHFERRPVREKTVCGKALAWVAARKAPVNPKDWAMGKSSQKTGFLYSIAVSVRWQSIIRHF